MNTCKGRLDKVALLVPRKWIVGRQGGRISRYKKLFNEVRRLGCTVLDLGEIRRLSLLLRVKSEKCRVWTGWRRRCIVTVVLVLRNASCVVVLTIIVNLFSFFIFYIY